MENENKTNTNEIKNETKKEKSNKPFYQKWWFWVIIGVVVIGVAGNTVGNTSSPTTDNSTTSETSNVSTIEYEKIDATEMVSAHEGNPLSAQQAYEGKYVEFDGYVSVIDSDGSYVSIDSTPNDFLKVDFHCSTASKYFDEENYNAQIKFLSSTKEGEKVTIRGKITSVGEFAFYVDLYEIEKAQ